MEVEFQAMSSKRREYLGENQFLRVIDCKRGCNACRESRYEHNGRKHPDQGNDLASRTFGRFIAVTDCGHRYNGPPESLWNRIEICFSIFTHVELKSVY